MKLVPEVPKRVPVETQGVPRISKGKPENRSADEDVLHHGLELACALGRDHDSAPLGPPKKYRHGELATDQEQAYPKRNASPDWNVVEIMPSLGDHIDGKHRREEKQLVGDRVEILAEV